MSEVRYYYGRVIDQQFDALRQHLEALHGAASAEQQSQGADDDLSRALERLEHALSALG